MKRVHLLIDGVVQGVGYRLSLQREARAAGLAGWVRNRRDGRVEAELEGDPAAVDALIAWAHEGPRYARVTDVTVTDAAPQGDQGDRGDIDVEIRPTH